jgi:hypothetical protein
LHKIIKTRRSFPFAQAPLKLLYLAIKNAGVHWRRPVEWTAAMRQFAIHFGPRFPGFQEPLADKHNRHHGANDATTRCCQLQRSQKSLAQDFGHSPGL